MISSIVASLYTKEPKIIKRARILRNPHVRASHIWEKRRQIKRANVNSNPDTDSELKMG